MRVLAGCVALLLCCAGFLAASCARHKAPNVLLVTIDTIRADRVGCYGDAGAHTPNIDRLAREGALFEHAVTPVPMTLPSHSTILTGCLPARHGVHNNGNYHLPREAVTLAERFRDAGYRTGAFVSAFVLQRQFGLEQGFEVYDDSLYNERPGARTVARAEAWLARKDKRPFFLWVHLFDPHTPWTPPPPYASMPLRSGYEREIAAADGALGTLIESLRASKQYDRTIVAVIGDHGEGLNDHGELEHGIFLYDETVRVPWVLRTPGMKAAVKVPELVSTIDLAPTLVALAGLAPFLAIDGLSVAPALSGKPIGDRHGIPLETVYPQQNFGWAPLSAWATERWKWIRAPEPELYDTKGDPGERANVRTAQADTASLLDRRLERTLAAISPLTGSAAASESKEVTERLRSLGYLSAGALTTLSSDSLPDPKRMIAFHPDFETAKKAVDDGRFADAIPAFRRVLAHQDRNLVALLGFGVSLNRTGDFPGGEAAFRRAIVLSPRNTTAIAGLADALFGQERWAEAIELYRLAQPDPLQARSAQMRIALCRYRLGQPEQGTLPADLARRFADYRAAAGTAAALRNGAGADTVRLRLARLAAGLGFLHETERLLAEPATDPAAEEQRLLLLEQLNTELGRPLAALEALRRLEKLRGGAVAGLRVREGDLLLAGGRTEEALSLYTAIPREELARSGLLPGVEYNRACALARLGRTTDAVGALEAAVGAGYDRLSVFLNDPDLDPLRQDPRYPALLESLTVRQARLESTTRKS